MDEIQLNPLILPALISLLILPCSINRWLSKPAARNKNFPPSPLKLPIIGNLHQLGSLPHRSLHSLARKHGPLMLLHFGSVPVLIVSSADAAREIMLTHDLIFANRPLYKVFRKLLYGGRDVTASPYGEYWRQMKSILVHELLSNKKVQSFRCIREEETTIFMEKIREFESSSRPVNLSNMFDEFTNNAVCRSAFGKKYSESEEGKKFLRSMSEFMELLGSISVGDFIPWLGWISRVNGVDERVNKVAKEMDEILEGVIQEHMMENRHRENGESLVDVMLEINNGDVAGVSIERDSIKALILDAFLGGTDSQSTTLEWAMTELLRHPIVMKKLQKEIREITKGKQDITDDDLEKMQYLKAVIKETFRYHPPAPLLGPRIARENVKIKGYDILAGTITMINGWAIGRDPLYWNEPEKFMPERFLNSSIDFKGQDFELIPFGAGRRKCPGITFADVTIEFVLANIVQKFNWELPNGVEGKDLDMSERPGMTVRRGVPLLAVASQSE